MGDDLHAGTAGGLLQFLEYSAEKGLLNARTAGARKSACTKVLEIDGPKWRERKVAEIDVEDQIGRFSRKAGSRYRPGSLATYSQRFQDALAAYIEFLSNPTGYRGLESKRRTKAEGAPSAASRRQRPAERRKATATATSDLITYPFPLSGGALGYVQLPREVTAEDAERLCHFIRSLSIAAPGSSEQA